MDLVKDVRNTVLEIIEKNGEESEKGDEDQNDLIGPDDTIEM